MFGSFGKAVSKENIFEKLTNRKQELAVTAMFGNESGLKCVIFIEDLPYMFPTMFRFIWPSGFSGDVLEIEQELSAAPYLITNLVDMSNIHRGPAIDASYQVSVHLG